MNITYYSNFGYQSEIVGEFSDDYYLEPTLETLAFSIGSGEAVAIAIEAASGWPILFNYTGSEPQEGVTYYNEIIDPPGVCTLLVSAETPVYINVLGSESSDIEGIGEFLVADPGASYYRESGSGTFRPVLNGYGFVPSVAEVTAGRAIVDYFTASVEIGAGGEGEESTVMATQKTIWFSKTDDYENFESGVKDADSFAITIPTTNTLRWVEALDTLLVGTAGNEWKIASNNLDTPLTPTNFTIKQQTDYGSNYIQALKVNDVILFVDFVGRKVREAAWDERIDGYVAPDMSVMAEHLTLSGITCFAHQRNPDSILWCVLDDGSLVSMTYDRAQEVVAWAKHPIDGTVQSVCVEPGALEDVITISVARTVNSVSQIYIEQFASRTFTALEDCFFVDSGLTVENSPASATISGLTHLIGETVTVLGDGVVYTPTAVVDGSGEVTISTAVLKAQVGLPFTYKLEPMRPDVSGQGGTSHSSKVHVPELGISFLNTMNAKYGVSDSVLYDIPWTDSKWTNNSEITGLFSGDVVVSVDGGFSLDNNLIVSGNSPLPCTVRCLVPKMDITDR